MKIILLTFLYLISIDIPFSKVNVVPDLDVSLYFDDIFAYIYLHKKRRGYLAIGLGSLNMSNANMIVLEKPNNNNSVTIKDCYSYGEMPFNCNKDQLFEIMQSDINENKIEVLIRRRIVVNSNLSRNFLTNFPNEFIYGFTDHNILEYHYGNTAFFGSFEIFQNNVFNRDNRNVLKYPSAIVHAFLNIFLWILFCDAVIIIARFFKTIKYYHLYHGVFWFGVCIYTFIIINTIWGKRIHRGRNYPPHFYASIVILIFTIIQFFSGIFLTLKIQFNLGKLNVLISKKLSRYIHGIFGFICWLAVRVGCIYGAEDLALLFNIYIYLYLIIVETIIFVSIFCVLYYFYMKNNKYYNVKLKLKPEKIDPIIEVISKSNYFDLIKINSKRIIVFYKNRVYDINNIIHPGGNYIFKHLKFRDVSRFIFGSYGLEFNNSENWIHTNFAFSLLENNFLGDLNISYDFIGNKKNKESSCVYELFSVEKLNNNWNIYYFLNNKVEIKNYIAKLSEIGTYFNIKNNIGIFRNYTTIMSASLYNLNLNKNLLNCMESIIKKEKPIFNFRKEDYQNNLLPLVIKKYNSKTGVSEYLSKLKKNEEVHIEGPFGEGLFLEKSKNLTFITGGTGILPIYDFIDLIFKNICLEFLKSNKKTNWIKGIPELKLAESIKNYKITLISSFVSDEEFFGIPYLNMISKLQKLMKINIIDINIKFSKKSKNEYEFDLFNKRIDKNLILEKIQNKQEKIYICGPPLMNSSVLNILKNNYYENVYLV